MMLLSDLVDNTLQDWNSRCDNRPLSRLSSEQNMLLKYAVGALVRDLMNNQREEIKTSLNQVLDRKIATYERLKYPCDQQTGAILETLQSELYALKEYFQ